MSNQRIAFVITGGAAKGAYSAGVLKALAQAGIIPDLVVGSSSGAINGAFCAAYVAADRFTPQQIGEAILPLWTTHGSIWHMLRFSDGNTRALRNLFRLGNLFAPSLQFTSLASQRFLANILQSHLDPLLERLAGGKVSRPVKLMVAISDLRGCPHRVAAIPHPVTVLQFAHYGSFAFQPPDQVPPFERLQETLLASSALPFLFSPVEMTTSCAFFPRSASQPPPTSLFADGGLIDNAPIGQVLHHAGINEIYVVSPHPFIRFEDELNGLPDMASRFLEVLLTRNLLNDLQEIERLNQRKRLVEAFCREQGLEPTETLCLLAGFGSLQQYQGHQDIRLHLLAPVSPLPGHALSGFFDRDLRADYIRQGYEDGLRYLVDHLSSGLQPTRTG